MQNKLAILIQTNFNITNSTYFKPSFNEYLFALPKLIQEMK